MPDTLDDLLNAWVKAELAVISGHSGSICEDAAELRKAAKKLEWRFGLNLDETLFEPYEVHNA